MLQFHSAICELLHIPPTLSPERLTILDERERTCGIALPSAVREWFAIVGAEVYFSLYTNEDHLVTIEELGLGQDEHIDQGWLMVAWENQGVVLWFCWLDGTDDPSVWHDDDTYSYVPFREIPWVQCSFSFSGFIFDSSAGSQYKSWEKGLYIRATSPTFSDAMRETLQSHFQQGPFTKQDQQKVHRFYNEQALIRVSEGGPSEGVTWTIHPASVDALPEILALLKPSRAWLENWQVHGWGDKRRGLAGQRVLDEYGTSGDIMDS